MWSWFGKIICAIRGKHSWKQEPPIQVCSICGKEEKIPTPPGPTPGPTPEPTPESPIVIPAEYSGRPITFPIDSEREGDNTVNVLGRFELKGLCNDVRTGGPACEKDVWITQRAVKSGAVKWTAEADGSLLVSISCFTTPAGKKLRAEGFIPVSDSQGRPLRKVAVMRLAKADQTGTCRAYWTRVE